MIWVGIGIAGLCLLGWLMGKAFSPRATAESLRRNKERLHQSPAHYRVVDGEDFAHLDLAFYRNARERLEARGFTVLGDVTRTLPIPIFTSIFFRTSCSADGSVLASRSMTARS